VTEHTLVLLRHGKSDWSGGEPDHERPLAPRGRRQAAEAGRWLAAHVGHLDLALVSTAARAAATWDVASAELADPPPVRHEESAYAASAGTLLGLLRALPDDVGTVVLVGHNPGLEDLAESLCGSWVHLPTSALAVLDLESPWRETDTGPVTLRAAGRPPR
jgi:phosphohistidine phosphatase